MGAHTMLAPYPPTAEQQFNLHELFCERMPMGIAFFDRALRLQCCNPTWADFVARYGPALPGPVAPGMAFFDLAPGTEPVLLPLFERVLQGETIHREALRLEIAATISYWDAVLAPLYNSGRITGLSIATNDVTRYQCTLEELNESQRALSILMSNLPGMAFRCRNDRNRTMEFVSDGCMLLTGYTPTELIGNRRCSYAQLIHPTERDQVWEHTQAALHEGRPFQLFYRLNNTTGVEKWVWEQSRGIYSAEGSCIAIEGFVTDITERTIAYQTLEERVRERTHEIERRRQVAESLRDMLAILNSNQPLAEILNHIVTQAQQLLNAEAGAIFRLHADKKLLTIQAARGLQPDYVATLTMPCCQGAVGQTVRDLRPIVVTNLSTIITAELMDDPQRRVNLEWLMHHFRGLVAVPLNGKDTIYGSIVLYYHEPREFSEEELRLIVAFSDQAALAIETARLRAQAEQAAVVAERNRLARDLHDSVTQTLFSANLIAEVLPQLWSHSPAEGQRRLEELRQLTHGALAEMRALLLELRPTALTEVDLDDLLRQLSEAIAGRARIPISLKVMGQRAVPPDVQVALYRIAQEALNNVARHAAATHATIELNRQPQYIELHISDNGCGFRRETFSGEHLGLTIMAERAADIGARLTIESQPGMGTHVVVAWSDAKEVKNHD